LTLAAQHGKKNFGVQQQNGFYESALPNQRMVGQLYYLE
jgi:hypothetical protein